ncbi:hypothetical protein HZH66_012486 [Vespula vulgaris]|uniref:Uncharacterized protein n=1 Tax=Vespula vulgaris TaxID=7454 RepID=A0A834JAY8_VESVU|nr:hypothetical protein HZH66_012486 [Vespula vulgaris]
MYNGKFILRDKPLVFPDRRNFIRIREKGSFRGHLVDLKIHFFVERIYSNLDNRYPFSKGSWSKGCYLGSVALASILKPLRKESFRNVGHKFDRLNSLSIAFMTFLQEPAFRAEFVTNPSVLTFTYGSVGANFKITSSESCSTLSKVKVSEKLVGWFIEEKKEERFDRMPEAWNLSARRSAHGENGTVSVTLFTGVSRFGHGLDRGMGIDRLC